MLVMHNTFWGELASLRKNFFVQSSFVFSYGVEHAMSNVTYVTEWMNK